MENSKENVQKERALIIDQPVPKGLEALKNEVNALPEDCPIIIMVNDKEANEAVFAVSGTGLEISALFLRFIQTAPPAYKTMVRAALDIAERKEAIEKAKEN